MTLFRKKFFVDVIKLRISRRDDFRLTACMRGKLLQSCLTLWDPMECSPPGSSVHGILQARTLERVAMPSSKGPFRPRDRTRVSCIAGGFFTAEPPRKPSRLRWTCIRWRVLVGKAGRRHRHTEEGHVQTEAEIGVMRPEVRGRLEPRWKRQARILPSLVPWQGAWPSQHLDFGLWPPDSEQLNFCCF